MAPHVQLQMFQRSFSTKGRGRGIGTYSVKLLTEKYLKGRVAFTSDPLTGTTFSVMVPLLPAADDGSDAPGAAVEAAKDARSGGKLRVLIVEDDLVSRTALRQILERIGGVEVFEARDGEQGWQLLNSGNLCELCFLDLYMPRMGGEALLDLVRNDNRFQRMKVCICWAITEQEVPESSPLARADFRLTKPYACTRILEIVENARRMRCLCR
jgi:CheY-like chemotaxis protein